MRFRIVSHETVDSTNERAFAALAGGSATSGDVHVARAQSHGRGRLGRSWESPPSGGLYMSLVYAPERRLAHPAALSIAAGLAVFDTVIGLGVGLGTQATAARTRLKWPNDLLVGEAKLAGILVESRDAERFVLGIGINVQQRDFPAPLLEERPVTSLALEGWLGNPEEVLEQLLPQLGTRLESLEAPRILERDYLEASGLEGRTVRVRLGERTLEGRIVDLQLAGGLRIARPGAPDVQVPLEHIRTLEPA